ncbi:hypothetical protein ACVR0A_01160 [Streptococcus downei]|uniref:Uncharacterized protein n=1 Tax=Streptococcus downei MFe28 TaxID=764290 RepID=A0A380JEX1_STRDO|nr:hypothetical protein [Streptococcus downei]SUN35947.1 Uncharacterised protein [Streptococcus downei MFe28]
MNKQDWIEYFEAINGRTPSEAEIAQALATGDFAAEDVADAPVAQPVSEAPTQADSLQASAQEASSAQVAAAKEEAPQAPAQELASAQVAAAKEEAPQAAPAPEQVQAEAANAQAAAGAQGAAQQVTPQANQFAQAASGQAEPNQAGQFAQAGQAAPGQQQVYYQQGPDGQIQAVMAPVPKQPNPQAEAFKKGFSGYFSWFGKAFVKPEAKAQEGHPIFGLITIGLASWFAAWGLVNFFHRILMAYSLPSYRSDNFKDTYHQAVSSHFGILKTLLVLLIFFVFYTVLTAVPVLFNKDKSKGFFTKLGQYFSYTPIIFVLNFLAFVVTWFIPGKVTKKAASVFYEYGVDKNLRPLNVLTQLGQKGYYANAFGSVHIIAIIMLTLFVIGFAMILLSLVKNLDFNLGKVNSFYVTLAVTLLFSLLMVGFNKTVSATFRSGFDSVHDVFHSDSSSDYDDDDSYYDD